MSETVKFANKKDSRVIAEIVKRLKNVAGTVLSEDFDYLSMEMDISATHANGCPLRLEDLLKSSDSNFIHDLAGINKYINRKTGKLEECFWPRFARTV